jgi:hypothetical protein
MNIFDKIRTHNRMGFQVIQCQTTDQIDVFGVKWFDTGECNFAWRSFEEAEKSAIEYIINKCKAVDDTIPLLREFYDWTKYKDTPFALRVKNIIENFDSAKKQRV